MQSLDELIQTRPYQRIGTSEGPFYFALSSDRKDDEGLVIPFEIDRFREYFRAEPLIIFSYSVPLPFSFIDMDAGDNPSCPIAIFLLEFEREVPNPVERAFVEAVASLTEDDEIDRSLLPRIVAERDALQGHVERAGEQIRGIAKQTVEILLVWISEALLGLEPGGSKSEGERELKGVLGQVALFWDRLRKGFPLDASKLRKWMPALYSDCLASEFVSGQEFAVLHHALMRDRINREAMKSNDRRQAFEHVLHFVLTGKSIAVRRSEAEKRYDSRVRGAHLQVPMVKRYYQIIDSLPGIRPTQARSHVLSEYGNPVGDRQLLRYIQKLPRYKTD